MEMPGAAPLRPPGAPKGRVQASTAERRSAVRMQAAMMFVLILVLLAAYELFQHRASKHIGASPAVVVTGVAQDRPMPNVALTTASGRATSLAALRGKVVVLAPFATQCSAGCASTISAFSQLRAELRRAGVSQRVALVQVTVDPAHDTPARLASFSALTGASWQLLTGTPAQVGKLWRYLGLYNQLGPASSGPPLDWLTHRAPTHGVSYADAVYFVGPHGNLRVSEFSAPRASLDPGAQRLVSLEGLHQPGPPKAGWTVSQAVGNIEVVLDRRIPIPG